MSVGGAFDMIAGKTRRAPVFIRTIGCEWLYRLILEPWRWRRQLALLKFIFLCIRYH
ncbi:WecB/TagA/CpsF family glycosyltransferase [Candidatus Gottesmanbacteria bacterium]|nr:WecB/TagA/CpsF family glycosyltransferase [Candidatus Gottesmanbacteria bacterium]